MSNRIIPLATTLALAALCTPGLTARQDEAGIELRISEEVAGPGAIAQLKVSLTEPKPISTGGMSVSFADIDEFVGIAALSPTHDAYGVAQVHGSDVRLSINSPSATAGTDSDYPLVTIAARVPATAAIGSVIPITTANGFIRLFGPAGAPYPTEEIDNGSLTVRPRLSIDDIIPGSADVPAGGIVTVVGRGFQPATRIRFGEVDIAATRYIDPQHINVVLGSSARMHGVRVRAENPDGFRTTYFSYQRTRRQGRTMTPALTTAVPLFPLRLTSEAHVVISGVPSGLALQNISPRKAAVRLDLLSPTGQVLKATSTSIGANRYMLRELSEWFGVAYGTPASVRVRSNVPIQVLGIRVDGAGEAFAFLPR